MEKNHKISGHGLINFYENLYGLEKIQNEIAVHSETMFNHCKKGAHFVTIVIVNNNKIFYRSIANHPDQWEIPGGYMHDNDPSIESAVMRIAEKEAGAKIDELRPLCIVENYFKFKTRTHSHKGIAFIARTRDCKINIKELGLFGVLTNRCPDGIARIDKQVLDLAHNFLARKHKTIPYNEIDEGRNLGWKLPVHRYLVHPVQFFSTNHLRKKILSEVIGNTVLDASCGDDSLIIQWANKNSKRFCVANDISWKLLEKQFSKPKNNNVIFTNHNMHELPFRSKFDTVIFKNTLHHLKKCDVRKTIIHLLSLAKHRILIIDVENPRDTKTVHRLWNKYYTNFLKDQGHSFLSYPEFQALISDVTLAKFGRIKTNRGNYMYAICEPKNLIKDTEMNKDSTESIEVEVRGLMTKVKLATVEKFLKTNGVFVESRKRILIDYSLFLPDGGVRNRSKDIRIRSTNGQSEIIVKIGRWGENENREEISVKINDKFDNLAKLFHTLGFSKGALAIRNSTIYKYDEIEFALVEVPDHSYYFEAEQIVRSNDDVADTLDKINRLCKKLKLIPFNNDGFMEYIEELNSEANIMFDYPKFSPSYFKDNFGI